MKRDFIPKSPEELRKENLELRNRMVKLLGFLSEICDLVDEAEEYIEELTGQKEEDTTNRRG